MQPIIPNEFEPMPEAQVRSLSSTAVAVVDVLKVSHTGFYFKSVASFLEQKKVHLRWECGVG